MRRNSNAISSGIEAGTRKDWMSISQCAPDLSCLTALCDEAQFLNALAGFTCVRMRRDCLADRALCLFHGFLSMKALSYNLCFVSLWCTVYGQYGLGGWTPQAETTQYNLHPICSSLGLAEFQEFFFFFSMVYGILASFFSVIIHYVERQGTLWDRGVKGGGGGHVIRPWAWHKPKKSCLHPLKHQDALWVNQRNLDPSLEIRPQTISNVRKRPRGLTLHCHTAASKRRHLNNG